MPQLTTYIDKRLSDWSEWLTWGAGVGPQRVVSWYEKVVMAPNVQGRGGDSQPCPVNESDAYQMHLAIAALSEHLRHTIWECYRWSGTAEMKARRLRISRDQYYARLALSKHKLLGYLNDIEAGLPLPAPEPCHKNVKRRVNNKPLTLSDTIAYISATVA